MDSLLEYLLRSTLKSWNRRIIKLEEKVSALDDKLAELDQATNDIAAELEDLRGQITAGDAGAAARLDPIIARLQSLAADPNNPVPPVEPTV